MGFRPAARSSPIDSPTSSNIRHDPVAPKASGKTTGSIKHVLENVASRGSSSMKEWAAGLRSERRNARLVAHASRTDNTAGDLSATSQNFLKHGVNPNAQIADGRAVVQIAEQSGNKATADAITSDYRFDARTRSDWHDPAIHTKELHRAVSRYGDLGRAQERVDNYIRSANSPPDLKNLMSTAAHAGNSRILFKLMQAELKAVDGYRARQGPVADVLRDAKADPVVLQSALGHALDAGDKAWTCIGPLLDAGADPRQFLENAVVHGDTDTFVRLMRHGASPNTRLKDGTPLIDFVLSRRDPSTNALDKAHAPMLQRLLDHGRLQPTDKSTRFIQQTGLTRSPFAGL